MSTPQTAGLPDVFDNARVLVACHDAAHGNDYRHLGAFGEFMYSASDLIAAGRIDVVRGYGYVTDLERAKIAWRAVQPQHKYTHLFFYDVDMTFSVQDISALLAHGKDIVSGTYFMRGTKTCKDEVYRFPCVSARNGKYITREEIKRCADAGELIPVHSVGCGSLLVTVDALNKIGSPWFQNVWHIGGDTTTHKGEDSFFSDRARDVGLELWMDPRVRPWHIAASLIGYDVADGNVVAYYTPDY